MTSNNSKVDNDGTTEDIEDDEFDDLFNFTSPSTITAEATSVVPVRASSPIQFGLDSDSSDSEVDDSAQPTSSKNNVSLESSSYYEVSSSTGTSTPTTDGPKESDILIAGNVNSLIGDTGVASGLALERQGEDDFQELDEGTRDFLDWLDKPKTSTAEAPDSTEKDPERSINDDDLDFVDIHMPDKVSEKENEGETNRSKETLIILGEEEEQTSANLPTIATMPKKDESTQIISLESLTPIASTDSDTAPAPHQFNSILTESHCSDVEDFNVISNVTIEGGVGEIDEDFSEGESDIEDLFLTEDNEEEAVDDITFTNLSEAIRSTQSNVQKHIMPLLKSKAKVSIEDRPWLWTKAICGKVLSDVKSSSLADSFVSWDQSFSLTDLEQSDNLWKFGVDDKFAKKLLKEVDCLADRIVTSKRENTEEAKNKSKRDLSSLLLFYYHSGNTTSRNKMNEGSTDEEMKNSEYGDMEEVIDNTTEDKDCTILKRDRSAEASKTSIEVVEWNSLIGPIAATLLSSSVCAPVASVMLSTIIPVAMPLVSLTTAERLDAAKKIHSAFYLLVCYHLPMLVLHLDRYCPGWHWPKLNSTEQHAEEQDDITSSPTKKGRNLGAQGIIPMTWFTSQLAGECTADGTRTTTELYPDQLLHLWDILLSSNDHSLPFFLALRMLERNSYKLLMLRGEDLTTELTTVMCFQETTTAVESFMGYDETGSEDISPLDSNSVVDVWWDHAVSMRESTPVSVVCDLQKAEDNAVSLAFQLRHIKAMNNMKLRLEQEAEEHMAAIEEKRCMREEEVQYEFYKARLQKFYKKHCPDRLDKVDSVLKVYEGRYQLLNDRLSKKYGSGFIPIFSPKLSMKTNNLMSHMGHGIRGKRKEYMATMVEKKTMELFGDVGMKQAGPKHQVAVNVETSEILPSFVTRESNVQDSLKYYLVDSRPEEMATLQGRFPTSVRLSPDDLMDPDRMQQKIDMFEALRGAVHICIMGEGFSSFPSLYSHPLSKQEERLLDDDETRTNMCALFFIKRGFPFVSILDGGFAAAHAWLARDCTHTSISSVLVDYDEELSLFAQLERSYRNQVEFANASTREKTTLVVQELIDRSMTRLTISENKMEQFAEHLRAEAGKIEVKESVSKILKRSANQIKKGVNQVKRSNSGEETERDVKEEKIIARPHSTEESKKDTVTSEGMTLKMRIAEFGQRSKDRVANNATTTIAGNEKEDTHEDGENLAPKEKEGRSFKNLKLNFGGMAKANMNPDLINKQTLSVNPVKRGLHFLSQRETRNIDSGANPESEAALPKGQEPVINPPITGPPKKNFGSEGLSLRKGFEFKKISLPRFNKQHPDNSPVKDALSCEPSKPTALKFKRNPFAKKVASSDNDLDRAIAAALGGEEKSLDPKPNPLREKFVGLTKSASMGIKVAAMSTPQIKRPVLSFNKLGSVNKTPRKHIAEEESVSFEDIDGKNSVEKSD